MSPIRPPVAYELAVLLVGRATLLSEAAERERVQLKGHRLVGGTRASIYNAMPLAVMHARVDSMRDFERHHA